MIEHLAELESAQLITRHETDTALTALEKGTDAHTIGYEAEVLQSAAADIPNIYDPEDTWDSFTLCEAGVQKYGYQVGSDGIYELQSPASTHPHALTVATRGIVNSGWLPDGTKGLVTAHVSIGTAESLAGIQEHRERMVTMLRAVEQLRGTTPYRLLSPVIKANRQTQGYAWDQKGALGIDVAEYPTYSRWEGDNKRIEFRTLGYYDPEQFGSVLNNIYYLTRGLLSKDGSQAASIYADYDDWLQDHFASKNLPRLTDATRYDPHTKEVLNDYFMPYAEHLANGLDNDLALKTKLSVLALREEFGMTDVPLDESEEKHLSRKLVTP